MRKLEQRILSLANLKLKQQEANRREPIAEMWQSIVLQKGLSLSTKPARSPMASGKPFRVVVHKNVLKEQSREKSQEYLQI